jgi:hypothetical protein
MLHFEVHFSAFKTEKVLQCRKKRLLCRGLGHSVNRRLWHTKKIFLTKEKMNFLSPMTTNAYARQSLLVDTMVKVIRR